MASSKGSSVMQQTAKAAKNFYKNPDVWDCSPQERDLIQRRAALRKKLKKGLVLGVGNPLLDISCHMGPEFLKKYDLKANNAILAEEKHMPMYEEMKAMPEVEYSAGGATQNSMRVMQWIMTNKHKQVGTFMGCVGKDDNARILQEKAEQAGLRIEYQVYSKQPTGTCAVVVTGEDRSLCANLGAANHFTIDHIHEPCNKAIIEKANFAYISAFFLTASAESALEIAKQFAARDDKTFSMNLAAPFLAQVYTKQLMSVFPYIDILFGNDEEFVTFAKVNNLEIDMKDHEAVAKAVSKMEHVGKHKRIAVLTQGKNPVIVACGFLQCRHGNLLKTESPDLELTVRYNEEDWFDPVSSDDVKIFPVIPIPKEMIYDTNGCGDAFVGGFLAMYCLGKPIECAVKCGIYCASEVIQRSGCTYPEKSNWRF
ncbi:unnamed protein product [Cyprideis torosa]|uniref:adenosine kinase n=1 Tax=Cyprideis torosa TaxID=163714 RepID=A0A7R8ZN90_9CRUS|nr:unnamed protein product [Cyprideis torosa]CAG0895683.1 unnamed protein product [Cyprideis torosa]